MATKYGDELEKIPTVIEAVGPGESSVLFVESVSNFVAPHHTLSGIPQAGEDVKEKKFELGISHSKYGSGRLPPFPLCF